MLHLITGTPGSGKTLYAVFLIDQYENKNKAALLYNEKVFQTNSEIIEKNNLQDYFSQHTYFSKISKQYETVIFDDGYFNYLSEKKRTENIFLDVKFYNAILDKIRADLDIQLKSLKFIRHIYSNIDGLKLDNVRPMVVDWRECPDGSIIFYDEIQLIDEYSTDNKKDEKGIVKMLTVHRHRAFDIYGITQFPRLVHSGFRDVVGLHYHLHRGWGAASAMVYVWANCREKPNSLGNKFTAERKFRFNYPKRLYEIYESATADTVKLRIPLKIFALLLIPLFGLYMVSTMFTSKHSFLGSIFGHEKPEQVKQMQNTSKPASDPTASNSPVANFDPNVECRKSVNVEKKECKSWFDQLSKNHASVSQNGQVNIVSYNPDKPFNDKNIRDSIQYTVVNKPRFSGCVQYNGRYYGYTEQGTRLKISQSDCQKVMSGDRPYDYFTPRPVNVISSNSVNSDNSVSTDDNQDKKNQKSEVLENKSSVHLMKNTPTFPEKDITKPSI